MYRVHYIWKLANIELMGFVLVEAMDSMFMFGGFSGFESAVFELNHSLQGWSVDPDSDIGQAVFAEFVEHAVQEYYGDFDRFADCEKCGQRFRPNYSLAYVNCVRKGMSFCEACDVKK